MDTLRQHNELKDLFNQYKNPISGLMSAAEIKNFLVNEQGLYEVTLSECEEILTRLFMKDGS